MSFTRPCGVRPDPALEKHLPEFRGQMVAVYQDDATRFLEKPRHPITVRNVLSLTSGQGGLRPWFHDQRHLVRPPARVTAALRLRVAAERARNGPAPGGLYAARCPGPRASTVAARAIAASRSSRARVSSSIRWASNSASSPPASASATHRFQCQAESPG